MRTISRLFVMNYTDSCGQEAQSRERGMDPNHESHQFSVIVKKKSCFPTGSPGSW